MKLCIFALIALLVTWPGKGAQAQLQITLLPSTQIGTAGSSVGFEARLQNTGTQDLFLNSDNFSLFGVGLTMDDTKFFLNAPAILPAGMAIDNLPIFDVSLDSTVGAGTYSGVFTVIGGADSSAQDDLASSSFTVSVVGPANVPEPQVSLYLTAAVTCLGSVALKRSRRRTPMAKAR